MAAVLTHNKAKSEVIVLTARSRSSRRGVHRGNFRPATRAILPGHYASSPLAWASSRKLWRIGLQRLRWRMTISFARHQFPPRSSGTPIWLYARFTLSYRDVEDLLAERGVWISARNVRRWLLKFMTISFPENFAVHSHVRRRGSIARLMS